jgi:hypothetical protein
MIPDPVFILAPPRSFTSVAAAMLGRHPELFALPETNLPSFDTVGDLLTAADTGPEPMADGLVRAVAQLLEGMADSNSVTNTSSAERAGEVDAKATTEADGGRPGYDRSAAEGWLGRTGHCP